MADEAPDILEETIWERGRRDFGKARESGYFWWVEGAGGVIVGSAAGGLWGGSAGAAAAILFMCVIAFVFWTAPTAAAVFRQRDEARNKIRILEDMQRPLLAVTDIEVWREGNNKFVNVYITNTSSTVLEDVLVRLISAEINGSSLSHLLETNLRLSIYPSDRLDERIKEGPSRENMVKSAKFRREEEKPFSALHIIDNSERWFKFYRTFSDEKIPTISGAKFKYRVNSETYPVEFSINYEEDIDWWRVTLLDGDGAHMKAVKEPPDDNGEEDDTSRSPREGPAREIHPGA